MKSTYSDYSWTFLAASPSFSGPFFEESVILLLEDSENGSFGIIVNKPTGKTIGEMGGKFDNELANIEVFDGGPLCTDKISLALCCDNGKNEAAFSFGAPPEKILEIMRVDENARVAAFSGYAQWAPKQLHREIEEGTWVLSNVDIGLVFDTPPSELWKQILLKEIPHFQSLTPPKNTPDFN